jgi:AbrB family looped-hinge helix DNA binding protein
VEIRDAVISFWRCALRRYHTKTVQCHITCLNAIMITTVTIDKAGRIVLPKLVRDELQLSSSDSLELETSEERVILRPVRGKRRIYKKQGVWVFNSGEPLDTDVVNRTIREVRKERDLHNLGKLR